MWLLGENDQGSVDVTKKINSDVEKLFVIDEESNDYIDIAFADTISK